jgi:hypothetical protein
MPQLAVQELEFVFVNRVLKEFIAAQNQSLQSVSLRDHYSAMKVAQHTTHEPGMTYSLVLNHKIASVRRNLS